MSLAIAVKAHIGIPTSRRWRLKRRHQVRGTWRQGYVSVDTPAVRGKLRDLCPADERTLFPAVCLHSDRVRFHENRVPLLPQLHFKVDADSIIYVQHDSLVLFHFKTRSLGL